MPSRERLDDPGYTPSQKDLGAVLDWLLADDEATASAAERALLSAAEGAIAWVIERYARTTEPSGRARLVRLLGRMAQRSDDPRLGEVLLNALDDAEPRVQRIAIVGCGKLPLERAQRLEFEPILLRLLVAAAAPERRAIVEALGKVGGAASLHALSNLDPAEGFEQQLIARAQLQLGRRASTLTDTDRVLFDVAMGEAVTVAVFHRRGLSEIVSRQLAPVAKSEPDGPERRRIRAHRGTFGELLRARSSLVPALVVELEAAHDDADWIARIVDAIRHPALLERLERLTSTRPRLRFELLREGHQRAFLWKLSERLSELVPRVEVHPQAALWDVQIDRGRTPTLYFVPQRFDDPRFVYRVRDISGASHPTIAAALADLLDPRPNDVIWDPFVGSGLELIECARRGPYRELIGTDNNARSLEAARANVEAARLDRVRLLNADARTASIQGVTAIVTNPPLGIRHRRDGQLEQLLLDFIDNARRNLGSSGRLVWLSPMPEKTARLAEQLGFAVRRHGAVDVGGLSPELQLFDLRDGGKRRWPR